MKKNLLIAIITILCIWLIILSISLYENNKKTNTKNEVTEYNVTGFSTDLTKVVEASKSSIVSIEQDGTYSTGFIYSQVDNKVYVVSSYHGVSEGESAIIYFNSGVSAIGKVIGHDSFADVALIECDFDYNVNPIEIGDSTLLKDGEFVLSIGTSSSIEYDFSTELGMISNSYREIENNISFDDNNYDYYIGLIQLSGEFVSGYSGAPILNMDGEAVGMITMEDDGKTFAVTINEVRKVVEKIINNEEYTRITFGLKGKYINTLENYEIATYNIGLEVTSGYYVLEVKPSSFASSIGISKGDVITKINNVDIKTYDDVLDIIYSNERQFSVEVIRNNETMILQGNLYD